MTRRERRLTARRRRSGRRSSAGMWRRMATRLASRAGFSLVEVIVAMMVLTIGLLGMAAGTGWMIRTVHFGELETARSAAFQSAVESLRAQSFDDLANGSETFGDFTVSWTLGGGGNLARDVEIVVVGPGRSSAEGGGMPSVSEAVADTFTYRILRRD